MELNSQLATVAGEITGTLLSSHHLSGRNNLLRFQVISPTFSFVFCFLGMWVGLGGGLCESDFFFFFFFLTLAVSLVLNSDDRRFCLGVGGGGGMCVTVW